MKNQNSVIERIKAELAAFEEKKQAFVAELRQEFPTMFSDIFATAPNLKSVSWTQYTPYFNDGDTCEFSAHVSDLDINGRSEYDDDDEDDTDYISIRPTIYKKLQTEEDIRINKELAEKCKYTWYTSCGIGEEGLTYNPKYDADADRASSEISEVLSSIPDDFLRDLFGDHTRVTIYADGSLDTEDYDHD